MKAWWAPCSSLQLPAQWIMFAAAITLACRSDAHRLSTTQVLDLYNNSIFGTIPVNWTLPYRLFTLNLGTNQIEGTLPPGMWLPPGLLSLDFSRNRSVARWRQAARLD